MSSLIYQVMAMSEKLTALQMQMNRNQLRPQDKMQKEKTDALVLKDCQLIKLQGWVKLATGLLSGCSQIFSGMPNAPLPLKFGAALLPLPGHIVESNIDARRRELTKDIRRLEEIDQTEMLNTMRKMSDYMKAIRDNQSSILQLGYYRPLG